MTRPDRRGDQFIGRDPQEPQARLPDFVADPDEVAFLSVINDVLATAALPAARRGAGAQLPLIYVVGAPRSGTTLLSQVLSRYLPVGYIDNVVARFWLRPSVGIRLSDVLLGGQRRERIEFRSRHGRTRELEGPHEFGYFWRHWLNLDAAPTHQLTAAQLAALDAAGLRHQLHDEILGCFGRPTVFKNIICGLQAAWLESVHAPSVFIHIRRDLAATARSILHSRLERHGSYTAWWSLKTADFGELSAIDDPVAQVVAQIRSCWAAFDAQLSHVTAPVPLEYEALCRAPGAALSRVCEVMKTVDCDLTPLALELPAFDLSTGPSLPADMEARLRKLAKD